MKRKITVLLMALLLIIPFSGKKIAAEDKLPVPSNLRMDGNVLKWDAVEVDGTALSDSDYTAAPGSIKINLKPSFLNTVSKGTHILKVSFKASDEPYGYKEIEFKVADKGSDGPYSVPDTYTK